MILLYTEIILISGILAVLSAEYQDCFRKKQDFSLGNIKKHFLEKPLGFIIFSVMYVFFSVIAIMFYQRKNLSYMQLPQYVIFWEYLLLSAWIDFNTKKIPNQLFIVLLAVRSVGILAEMSLENENPVSIIISSLSGMLAGGFIILVCRLVSRGGIGAGDVKLFAVTGFFFGLIPVMNILFYSTFISALAAGLLLITKKAKMKSTLTLGPFVFIAINIYYILL